MLYRIGNKMFALGIPILPKLCDIAIRLIHNSAVFSATQIGEGTKFGYGGIGVVIHKDSTIGKNCMIGSNVTIGGRSRSKQLPRIGDGVYIATGAKILGDVSIGDNAVIGANAVVIGNVPNNSVAVGIPAKIVKTEIDPKDYI